MVIMDMATLIESHDLCCQFRWFLEGFYEFSTLDVMKQNYRYDRLGAFEGCISGSAEKLGVKIMAKLGEKYGWDVFR